MTRTPKKPDVIETEEDLEEDVSLTVRPFRTFRTGGLRNVTWTTLRSVAVAKIRTISSNYYCRERLGNTVSPGYPATALPSSSFHPASSIMIDGHFEGSLTEKQSHHGTTEGSRSMYFLAQYLAPTVD
jgi:hypothetical protein